MVFTTTPVVQTEGERDESLASSSALCRFGRRAEWRWAIVIQQELPRDRGHGLVRNVAAQTKTINGRTCSAGPCTCTSLNSTLTSPLSIIVRKAVSNVSRGSNAVP